MIFDVKKQSIINIQNKYLKTTFVPLLQKEKLVSIMETFKNTSGNLKIKTIATIAQACILLTQQKLCHQENNTGLTKKGEIPITYFGFGLDAYDTANDEISASRSGLRAHDLLKAGVIKTVSVNTIKEIKEIYKKTPGNIATKTATVLVSLYPKIIINGVKSAFEHVNNEEDHLIDLMDNTVELSNYSDFSIKWTDQKFSNNYKLTLKYEPELYNIVLPLAKQYYIILLVRPEKAKAFSGSYFITRRRVIKHEPGII